MVDWTRFFLDPTYLVWFWLLIPLVILYLIRPKPMNQTIPSLMFLLQDKARAFRNSFFKYLFRDFVMLLQFIIIALLVAAACQPFILLAKTQLVGNAVIVLDASASMQTDDGRWAQAVTIATQSLAGQNTIILVKNRPVIIGKDLSRGEAETLLKTLSPTDTDTNLYASIVAAREYVSGPDSVVTVISDFKNTDQQQDYRAAAKTIIATGAVVNLRGVGTSVPNTGIISLSVDEQRARIGIRNYRTESIVATLHVGSLTQAVPLAAGATEYVTVQTPPGVTEATLEPADQFMLDNRVTIANTDRFDVSVLLVTNDPNIQKTPLWYALDSISQKTPLKIHIDVSTPPTLSTVEGHDIVIFSGVNPQLLVQRTVRDTVASVQAGHASIIMAQPGLFAVNFEDLFPDTTSGEGGASAVDPGEFSDLTKDVEFGDVQAYARLDKTVGRTLAVAASDQTPLISLIPVGKGQSLYYGIDDRRSSFPVESTYPVFWKRMIDQLTGRVGVDRLNVLTGTNPLGVTGTPTTTPKKETFDGFFDRQGAYTYPDRTIAANLLSAEESDVSAQPPDQDLVTNASGSAEDTKSKELTGAFAILALILLFVELFIVKFRGDF